MPKFWLKNLIRNIKYLVFNCENKITPQLFLATFLRYSLSELLKICLDGSIHFVKCFKPNENTKSNELNKEYLKNQLVYSGIQEAVKSRKNGFPIRLTFVDFLTR